MKKIKIIFFKFFLKNYDQIVESSININFLRFHRCPYCKIEVASNNGKDDHVKHQFLRSRGILHLMYGCQWEKQRSAYKQLPTHMFPQLSLDYSTDDELLSGIKNGELYGFIKCDVDSLKEFIEKYLHLNFPPVIRRHTVVKNMMSEYMRQRFISYGRKTGINILIQSFHGKSLILFSPLAQFYIQLGLKLSNVQYFIQYQPYRCLEVFTKQVTSMRIAADYESNDEKSTTAKLVGNR